MLVVSMRYTCITFHWLWLCRCLFFAFFASLMIFAALAHLLQPHTLTHKRGVAHCARMRANSSPSLCVFCFSRLACGLHWANPETSRPYIMLPSNNNKEVRVEEAALAMFTVGGKSRTSLDTNNNSNKHNNDPHWLLLVTTSRKCQTTRKKWHNLWYKVPKVPYNL